MKIIFAGTPEFAVPILEALIHSEHEIIAVYTQPDRPAGRGQKLHQSPVKQLALTNNIPVYQPTTLRDIDAQQQLQNLKPDVMVVVAYGLILPTAFLAIPQFGCINVHPSLLPRWRGAAPIQRAILAGDSITGVTIMQMEEGLDSGPMLKKITCPIEVTDTGASLQKKLALLGSKILLTSLKKIKILKPELQDSTQTCYAQKFAKQEAEINWTLSAIELDRLIRAFNPWPVAYTYLQNQIIKIWQAEILTESTNLSPGTIVSSNKNGIDVATGQGLLRLLQIQLAGGRCLPVADLLHAKAALFAPGIKLG